jgi:hypothetical protein
MVADAQGNANHRVDHFTVSTPNVGDADIFIGEPIVHIGCALTHSERLGHSSIAITADLYTHAVAGPDADAAERMQSAIQTARGGALS